MNRSRARSLASLSILVFALALALGGVGSADGTTASLGPRERVKSSVSRALAIAQAWPTGSNERRSGIVRVTHELFDVGEMARRSDHTSPGCSSTSASSLNV